MNRMRVLMALACLLVCRVELFAVEKKCIVSGKINGVDKTTKLMVLRRAGGHGGSDTVMISKTNDKGEFSLSIPATKELLEMRFENNRYAFNLVSEQGNVVINADKNKLYAAELKGTPENEIWSNYQKFTIALTMQRNALNMNPNGDREERRKIFLELDAQEKHYTDSVIDNNPNSLVALYLAKVPLMMLKYTRIDSLVNHFKPTFANHKYFLEMKKRADILRKVAPGAMAPDFNVQQPDGKSKISLSSFRGKYVMLDFWASWCVPCRAENKHTKEIYEKYHSKGLNIISFSLDSDREAWTKAIAKDELTWNNASDLVGGVKSPVAQKYGIDGIPAIWIIDPNGKIIAEGIRGEALDKFLNSIFVK